MKPTEFKHQNIVFAKDQPEYQPLPALRIESPEGQVISCWKLSLMERIKVLFLGRLSLMSFNKPLTPSYMSINRKEVYSHPDDLIPFWKKLIKIKQMKQLFTILLMLVIMQLSAQEKTILDSITAKEYQQWDIAYRAKIKSSAKVQLSYEVKEIDHVLIKIHDQGKKTEAVQTNAIIPKWGTYPIEKYSTKGLIDFINQQRKLKAKKE